MSAADGKGQDKDRRGWRGKAGVWDVLDSRLGPECGHINVVVLSVYAASYSREGGGGLFGQG